MQAQKAGRVDINLKPEYLRGRVVALAERLQGAEGDEALQIVDELLGAAHQLIEISAGGAQ
ncbi:hypothetical protein [Geobacter benzoatilyticus]|uniref:Uncharacterized protein n=1 Tax=Geobacter benzoatilyticus TaxID=2815309 RepID=A0ABX7Q0T3_9BACT|nr:hypothetical protein [Geobacter benzoatilyticus]QSV45011.1 hypothetical protein JZM60_12745 [Geobacter benzoatilyticus]